MQHSISPIAVVHSAFKQKFGIPHQPGLAPSIRTQIELLAPYNQADFVRGLENCSHIWLLFLFSETLAEGWKPTVRPPRLGGKVRIGVFASRSPHRPNGIGISPVKLEKIHHKPQSLILEVSGADLLDGTPIIDIKPYLAHSDIIMDASYELIQKPTPLEHQVQFSEQAELSCNYWTEKLQEPLKEQIIELLKCDPRPAFKKKNEEKNYVVALYHLNIIWRIDHQTIWVDTISEAHQGIRSPRHANEDLEG